VIFEEKSVAAVLVSIHQTSTVKDITSVRGFSSLKSLRKSNK